MSKNHDPAETVTRLLIEKAEPRFNALIAQHHSSTSAELPESMSTEMLRRAFVETAAVEFPGADLEQLGHAIKFLTNPAFGAAVERVKQSQKSSDVFEPARGVDSAAVLAGLGLPVAPYDRDAARITATPTNDIDAVLALFSSDQTAFVGYDACAAPFYLFMTDCVRTLRQRVAHDPRFVELKLLFKRGGGARLPSDPGRRFRHAVGLFPRRSGDTISAVGLIDAHPEAGSIVLHAGWKIDGQPQGVPGNGYFPVPLWLVHAAINEPDVAAALWYPVAA